ncbi:MAG: amidinotransferase, partial [Pigmentiphaga sp.]|nr:amidinotransferase [Pigmentiphaga sp.]
MNATAKFLMVDPAHYEVRYRINPWMQPEQWMRDAQGLRAAARRAYDALRCALREAGCDVVVADGAP